MSTPTSISWTPKRAAALLAEPTYAGGEVQLSATRKWMITGTVMLVTVMQVLDVTVTNVALPHIQGSLSAGIDEVSWVLTSYLAANAVILPATGWLAGALGRKRFFLISTIVFTAASVLCGLAPNLHTLLVARLLQGIGGGPLMPLSQAIMWEIFPLEQRGTAVAVWGIGIMLAPILGPTVGGWLVDNWSWRWIFYINLPIGVLAFFMVSAFLFDAPFHKRPQRVDLSGIALMVIGFGGLQLMLDLGERHDWFESGLVVGLGVVAVCAIVGFILRETTAREPILDLSVFNDRNFAVGTVAFFLIAFGFNSSLLLLALYTQKVLGYDAWTSGLTLAPGGFGTMIALMISGRLVSRMDQRMMLAGGCLLQAIALWMMTNLTLTMDYWTLAGPRFLQGFGQGFIFPPLQTLALATIRMHRLSNATAAFNVVRNVGGSTPQLLDNDAVWPTFAPVFRSDFKLLDTWTPPRDPEPLPVPLSVFGGRRDKLISEDEDRRAHDDIQKITDGYMQKLEQAAKGKGKEILELPCDILIPAALEMQITEANAAQIKAPFIVEAANAPVAPQADEIFAQSGKIVLPDILANAGGVTVSYFEWVQDLQNFFWTEEEVHSKLRDILVKSFRTVLKMSLEQKVDMRLAALMMGVDRVARAMLWRGLYA